MGPYVLCLVTIDDPEKAREIAGILVQRGLAACVNIIPEIRSVYKWKGQLCDDIERMLIIKTRSELFEKLQSTGKRTTPVRGARNHSPEHRTGISSIFTVD